MLDVSGGWVVLIAGIAVLTSMTALEVQGILVLMGAFSVDDTHSPGAVARTLCVSAS